MRVDRPANSFQPFAPETLGSLAVIGIEKGKKFAPDARMKKILTEGVAIGNATARSITFRPRSESAYFYPGKRQWYSCFTGGSHEFMNNADGSYTMWFGPKPPKGHEGNWIQTMPGKGYNVLLRLYGPLQPWFDKTWIPGNLEMVK